MHVRSACARNTPSPSERRPSRAVCSAPVPDLLGTFPHHVATSPGRPPPRVAGSLRGTPGAVGHPGSARNAGSSSLMNAQGGPAPGDLGGVEAEPKPHRSNPTLSTAAQHACSGHLRGPLGVYRYITVTLPLRITLPLHFRYALPLHFRYALPLHLRRPLRVYYRHGPSLPGLAGRGEG